MSMVEEVGTRVVVFGGAEAVAQLNAVADAYERLSAAQGKLAESSVASADATAAASGKIATAQKGVAASAAESAGVSAGSVEATAAEADAATIAITRKKAQAAAARDLATAQRGVIAAQTGVVASNSSLSGSINAIATGPLGKMAKYFTVGGAFGIYEGIKQYMSFQKSMTQLSTQAGINSNRLPWLSESAKNIAKSTGVSLNDVANQYYRIASATSGLKMTNKELQSMEKSAANLSVLFNVPSGAPTEQTARLLGGLISFKKGGGRGVKGPAQMVALLNAAVGTGDLRGQDLVGAMGRGILQSAQTTGADLPDMLSLLDLMTRFNAQPSQAGTLLSHAIQMFATPSAQGQKAEAMLGVQQGQLRQILSTKGLGAALKFFSGKIHGKLSVLPTLLYGSPTSSSHTTGEKAALDQFVSWGMNPQIEQKLFSGQSLSPQEQTTYEQFMLTKMFGGARQELPLVSALMNMGLFGKIHSEIMKQANPKKYNQDLSLAMNTPAQQFKKFEQTLHVMLVDMGQAVTPAFLSSIHALEGVFSWFGHNKAALDAVIGVLAALVGIGLTATVANRLVKWGESLGKIFGVIGSSSSSAGMAAANEMQLRAAQLQLEAATMQYEHIMNPATGVAGAAGSGAVGAEAGAAGAVAADAGVVGAEDAGAGIAGIVGADMVKGAETAGAGAAVGEAATLGGMSIGGLLTIALLGGIAAAVGIRMLPGALNKLFGGYDPTAGIPLSQLEKVYPKALLVQMAKEGKLPANIAKQVLAKGFLTSGMPKGWHASAKIHGKTYDNVIEKHGEWYQVSPSYNASGKSTNNLIPIGHVAKKKMTPEEMLQHLAGALPHEVYGGLPHSPKYPSPYTAHYAADMTAISSIQKFVHSQTKILQKDLTPGARTTAQKNEADDQIRRLETAAAKQTQEAATTTGKAAADHKAAAAALSAAAKELTAAANELSNGGVKVDVTTVSKSLNTHAKKKTARA